MGNNLFFARHKTPPESGPQEGFLGGTPRLPGLLVKSKYAGFSGCLPPAAHVAIHGSDQQLGQNNLAFRQGSGVLNPAWFYMHQHTRISVQLLSHIAVHRGLSTLFFRLKCDLPPRQPQL